MATEDKDVKASRPARPRGSVGTFRHDEVITDAASPAADSAASASTTAARGTTAAAAGAGGGNLQMFGKLALLASLMFGFGWAMIPLYNAICEATGLRSLTKRDEGAAFVARNTQVDTSRTITVEFDTNMHGAFRFTPEVRSMQVHPGELATVEYELNNTTAQRTAGQAIPSYAPSNSARHFRKVQCFCFEQQTMEGHEVRRFPVVFVIDPELPRNIERITRSYTYYDVGGLRDAPQCSRDANRSAQARSGRASAAPAGG